MPNKALPDAVKRRKRQYANETRLRSAALHFQQGASGFRAKQPLTDVARQFNVDVSTLRRRVKNKGSSILAFNATKQKLTVVEESLLINFLLESAEMGFPLSHRRIEANANILLHAKNGEGYKPVGKRWVFNFLTRHYDMVRPIWSKSLDTQRAKCLNPHAVKSWFKIVEENIVKKGIPKENVYGMDESGFPLAYTGKERVIGARGTKTQHKQGGANRENITGIITICADGTTVKPLLIFKGKKMNQNWNKGNTCGAYITCSENGWTDKEIGLQWLTHVFDRETKAKANGQPRVLLFDGHSSHYSVEFLRYARENNIVVLGYPPHCTHALQGLDVVCFGKMKGEWKKEISEFESKGLAAATKDDFTGLFSPAYTRAFDEATVKSAFRATGIFPFDPNVITETQMKPSASSSIRGEFPLPQASPVRAVIAAMDKRAYAESMSTTPPTTPPGSPSIPHKRFRSNEIDPNFYTPTKRARVLHDGLSQMPSGSFLVSDEPYTSYTPIITPALEIPPSSLGEPNWSLLESTKSWKSRETLDIENQLLRDALHQAHQHIQARDMILEGVHAQLVVQWLHLRRVNIALNSKEGRKKNDRSLLFNGEGQVLSSDEFFLKMEQAEAEKEAKEAAKNAKKNARKAKKDAAAALEAEWVKIKADHDMAVVEWKARCEELLKDGVAKKNLPKKPVRPKKPTAPVEDEADGEDGEGGDEDDD